MVDLNEDVGPEVVTYQLIESLHVETGRYTSSIEATLDAGPMTITLRPTDLTI